MRAGTLDHIAIEPHAPNAARFGPAALLVFGVIAQGGFYPAQAWALTLGALTLAVLGWRDARRAPGGRTALWAAAALVAGLAASTVVNGASSWMPFATLVAAASAGIAGAASVARGEREPVLQAMTAAGALGAALAIAGVAGHVYPLAVHQFHVWRAAATLTYPNAAALLFTLSIGAAMLLAAERPAARAPRFALYAILTAFALTLSRGAIIAGSVALGVLVWGGGRRLLGVTVKPLLAAAVTIAGLIPSVVNDAAHPVPAVVGIILGCAVMLARPARSRRVAMAALALGLAALGVAALPLASRFGRIVSSRADASSANRALYWRAATHSLRGHLLLGRGPGNMAATTTVGEVTVNFRFAHEEPLQILAETGVVGLTAVAIAGALLASWAWRRRPPAGSRARRDWAVAVAGCTAFVIHGAFDFLWHIPVLVMLTFVWLAVAVTPADQRIVLDSIP